MVVCLNEIMDCFKNLQGVLICSCFINDLSISFFSIKMFIIMIEYGYINNYFIWDSIDGILRR